MARARLRGLACALLIALPCGATMAQSMIQKCRIDGRLVLQSGPCPLEPTAARAQRPAPAAAGAAAAPETAAAAPKKRTLADALRERDGADRIPTGSREARGDGASVLRERMGAV